MRNMKTICAIRDVFRAMTNFEASFEQVYQITLNEAMILCALKCSSERMTATNLSKQTDLSPSHTSKNAPDTGRKRTDRKNFGKRGPAANVLYPVCCRKRTGL